MELSAEKVKSALSFEAEVFVYEKINSTNIIGEELAKKYDKPIIIAAENQTDGRGRNGKSFYSPSTGLYFSLVTHPNSDFYSMNTVTCGTAVAVANAIEELTNLKAQIKWVNDIFIDGKKVCGILCKALGGNGKINHLVTGIGINISTQSFPEEIKSSAGSLNRQVDKNLLTAKIVNNIMDLSDGYMDEYRKKSCIIGKDITCFINNIPRNVHAVDIDNNGGLVVTDGKETFTLTGGETTIRLK